METKEIRMVMKDGRDFWITKRQYAAIQSERAISKSNSQLTVTDPDNGRIAYDGSFSEIKEFDHDAHFKLKQKETEANAEKADVATRMEMRKKREEWTREFLKDKPEGFMDDYREWARHDLSGAIAK